VATDYYAVLGVRRDASQDEIKKAFRRLARELHPDVNPDPKTQERFKEINAAYEVLSDPQKKQVYDLGGDPLSQSGGGGAGGFGAGGFGNFSDIMDAFFGTASQRGPRSRTRRGQDAMIRLEIELDEATRPSSAPPATVRARRRAPRPRPVTCVAGGVRCPRSRGPSSGRS
jgi:molecular chaperone DnaJ